MSQRRANSYIKEQYQKISRARAEHKEAYTQALYAEVPEIKKIDTDISLLALRCASSVIKEGITVEQALSRLEMQRDAMLARRAALVAASRTGQYVPLPYQCAKCRDTGYVDGKLCGCAKAKLRKYMMESARRISKFSCEIEKDTFENFRLDYYPRDVVEKYGVSPFDNIRRILSFAKKYCEVFDESSDNLFFNGASGLGKTFLANCIANELLSRGYMVIYQTAYSMFKFLEDYKFGKVDRDEYEENYNAIYDCDLLIIDDLGTEFVTSYTCSVFFDVLNSRLMSGKKTLISTNLTVKDLGKIYSERVSSRVLGEFAIQYFIGDDIRIKKRHSSL